ncbi:MAG: hypothetical protein ACJ8AY_01185 [Gemmatimonadales bacterium]
MVTALRAVVFAGLLFLPSQRSATAVQASGDTAALEFLGFRAGARLEELNLRLRTSSGSLRCRQSRADRRVSECRGALPKERGEPRVDVWVSAIDSLAGVMTLSGKVDSAQLGNWQDTLQGRYGKVTTRVQGTQRMLQWVRRGRMIRLTWRVEGGTQVASVSLVDGRVLDNWGRTSRIGRPQQPAQPEPQLQSRTR